MKNLINYCIFFFALFVITGFSEANLPNNISDLVKDSAPAVVNITSKKESTQSNQYGYGIPDELLERFGIPRQYRHCLLYTSPSPRD